MLNYAQHFELALSLHLFWRALSFFRSRPTYLNLLLLHNTLARSPLVGSSGIDRDRCLLPSSSPNDEGRSQEVAKQRIFTYIKQPPTPKTAFQLGNVADKEREGEGGSHPMAATAPATEDGGKRERGEERSNNIERGDR